MANIKSLKRRLKGTKSTSKITQAMKLVSAAKLAKAQNNILNSRPCTSSRTWRNFQLNGFCSCSELWQWVFKWKRKTTTRPSFLLSLLIKGLCSSYNSQLAKKVRRFLDETNQDVKIYFIGKKVRDLLAATYNKGKTYTFNKSEPTFINRNRLVLSFQRCLNLQKWAFM